MSDESTPKKNEPAENDGEHTVIDSDWGDKFKELEAKYAKDDSELEDSASEAITQEATVPSSGGPLLQGDPNALTSLDFNVNSDELPTLDPASNPLLPAEPSTMADRPFSKKSLDEADLEEEPSEKMPALPDDLVGPGFVGDPSDSFSGSDLSDDWGVTGHAQTGAWGVDETAFLHVDPTGDEHQGLESQVSQPMDMDPFAQVLGRIVCTAPEMDELSFDLVLGELSVGRAQECDITLDEPSVSRQHAALVVDVNGVKVTDLGSNNGIFVNGRRVQEATLKSRDEVSFGTVSTRYLHGDDEMRVDTEEALVKPGAGKPSADRVWKSVRSNPYGLPILFSAGLILATTLVAAVVVMTRAPEPGSEVKPDEIFQHFLNGVEEFKARRWDLAEDQFKILKGLDQSHAETLEYLDAVGEERRAENQMKLARSVRKQGNLKAAEEYARSALDSIYQQDVASELIASIELELDARLARAGVSLEAGQFGESIRLLNELEAQYPGRTDVRSLLAFAKGLQDDEQAKPASAAGATRAPEAEPAEKQPLSPQLAILGDAQGLFLKGDLDGALELLEQDGTELDAHVLAAQLHKFQTQWKIAQAEHRAKRSISALKALDAVDFLEGQIASEPSIFRPEIDKKRADMYYLSGVEALGHERFAVAARRFKRALAAVAGYEKATRQLNNLVERAGVLAEKAQVAQSSDPSAAREIWGDVLAMTPDGHPLHLQARRALKK